MRIVTSAGFLRFFRDSPASLPSSATNIIPALNSLSCLRRSGLLKCRGLRT